MILIILLLCLINYSKAGNDTVCTNTGKTCDLQSTSNLTNYAQLDNSLDCLQFCKDFSNQCQWVIYEDGICSIYSDCKKLIESTQEDSVYASGSCLGFQDDSTEVRDGFCTGPSLEIKSAESLSQCQNHCQGAEDCFEFTLKDGLTCSLFTNCSEFSYHCDHCITANVKSIVTLKSLPSSDQQSIVRDDNEDVLLITGLDFESEKPMAELYDLNSGQSCNLTIPQFTMKYKLHGLSTLITLNSGKKVRIPIICGVGEQGNDCVKYEPRDNGDGTTSFEWIRYEDLLKGISWYIRSTTELTNGKLLVYQSHNKATKIIDPLTMEAQDGPPTLDMERPCITILNSTHWLLTNTQNSTFYNPSTQEQVPGPPLDGSFQGYQGLLCGLYWDQYPVVQAEVIGGHTQIYNPETNTWAKLTGSQPLTFFGSTLVQIDKRLLYVPGTKVDQKYLMDPVHPGRTIFEFNGNDWKPLKTTSKMMHGYSKTTAIFVNKDIWKQSGC